MSACLVAFAATALSSAPVAETPTFAKDVAPLVYARCTPCHQRGGDAPFSLVTYDEVRRRAQLIAQVTASRYMPPWKPIGDAPAFVGDRRLHDDEIGLIERWVSGGAPEGRTVDAPPAPRRASGWLWGEPDLVVMLPAFTLRADGPDVFRNFVVTVPMRGTRFVRGLQFRPRSRGVHHANIRVDKTTASRALDEADPTPGYEGLILNSATYPDGHFLGWTPGQSPAPADNVAWPLEGGSDLVIQLHLRPTGRVDQIAAQIGLYFTDHPPAQRATMVRLGRQNLDIPAGDSAYQVTDAFRMPTGAEVVAIQPHAHFRAREVNAWATLPDGSRRPLLRITDWDFAWQDQYRLVDPMWLPAGSELAMTYTFDNSAENPRNPDHPPARVNWGWRSSDEMADVWIQLLTPTAADRDVLDKAARLKMLQEDAVGSEVLVARNPDYVALRNDAALIYRELGRPDRALVHFEAVSRIDPRSSAARYNEAVTLELLGREDEALAQYREAIRLDPAHALAHNALGNMWYRKGRLDEAMSAYRSALRGDANFTTARCSLARALTETDRPAEAIVEYRLALATAPDSIPCLINFAWLLSAHRDPKIRRPSEAVAAAEHAVALTNRTNADALDALAATYASAARFDDAIAAALQAVRLLDRAGAPVAEARARLELYRRRVQFFVPKP
jgi:tetratricopeptide (TPR) repeat protein